MDILRALDAGDLTMLTLLDLSAAFDTVDHATLLRRLEISYGIRSTSLGWFSSYLGSRFQYVRCGLSKSTLRMVLCGVPQGTVLGPILFLLYTADTIRLIESHCSQSTRLPSTQTIHRSEAFAGQKQLMSCKNGSQSVLTMWRRGREAIACNLTLLKPKFSGVRQAEDNIRFHRFLYELAMTWFTSHFRQGPWNTSRL